MLVRMMASLIVVTAVGLGGATGEELEQAAAPDRVGREARPWLAEDPFDRTLEAVGYRAAQRWAAEQLNLEFELGYTLIYQAASNVTEPQSDLVSGSYDFAGAWTLIDHESFGVGALGWLLEGGQVISHNRDEDLSGNVGSGLGINDDFDNEPIALTELWWQHAWLDDQIVLTVGKIDQTVYFDANRIANDETTQFLATPLVNNTAIAFPDNGFGFNVTVAPNEHFYLTGGWGNFAARATETTVNNLSINESFYALELGVNVTFGEREGTYRLIGWYVDSDEDGGGVAVSFDQEILADGLVVFGRAGRGNDELVDTETMISAGLGYEGPLGRSGDLVAVGVVWGDWSDETIDGDETVVELFYRFHVLETITVTPDVQVIFDPAAGDDDPIVVGALRVQATF